METETEIVEISELIELKESCPVKFAEVNPILRVLILGITDPQSVLFSLNGIHHVVEKIWDLVTHYWRNLISIPEDAEDDDNDDDDDFIEEVIDEPCFLKLNCKEDQLSFPEPTDININMMPFVMSGTFEGSKLPQFLKLYWDLIICRSYVGYGALRYKPTLIPPSEYGKIGYLTIHEGYVDKGESQRRPGLHTETPGKITVHKSADGKYTYRKRTGSYNELDNEDLQCDMGEGYSETVMVGWGLGQHDTMEPTGGIYMASNVPNSCAVWNCSVESDCSGNEIIGEHGDIEHLRGLLPSRRKLMQQNCMYWLTDRTPHESLPLISGAYRQYFRLVTSEVSVWFEDHSTPNSLGVEPDPEKTIIIKGSKY